jgi:hypothetical protein
MNIWGKNPCYSLGEKHAEHKKRHAQHTKRTELKRKPELSWLARKKREKQAHHFIMDKIKVQNCSNIRHICLK